MKQIGLNFTTWKKVGLMVEYPNADQNVVGLNPGSAEIGLDIFYSPHNGYEYWFTQEANTESGLV